MIDIDIDKLVEAEEILDFPFHTPQKPFRHRTVSKTGSWSRTTYDNDNFTYGDKWEVLIYLDQSEVVSQDEKARAEWTKQHASWEKSLERMDPKSRKAALEKGFRGFRPGAFPEELFPKFDLHHHAGGDPLFIGWVHGTETPNILFISEIQSDLLQGTYKLADPDVLKAKVQGRLDVAMEELKELEKGMKVFGDEVVVNDPERGIAREAEHVGMKARREELTQTIRDLEAKIEKIGGETHYPEFASRRSDLENRLQGKGSPKKWIQAFYNAAYDYAQDRELTFIMVPSADKVKVKVWSKLPVQEGDLYSRIYDKAAVAMGMERIPQEALDHMQETFKTGALHRDDWWAGMIKMTWTDSEGNEQPVPDDYRLRKFESVEWECMKDFLTEREPPGYDPDFELIKMYEKLPVKAFPGVFNLMANASIQEGDFDYKSAYNFGEEFLNFLKYVPERYKTDPQFQKFMTDHIKRDWEHDISSLWPGSEGERRQVTGDVPEYEPEVPEPDEPESDEPRMQEPPEGWEQFFSEE